MKIERLEIGISIMKQIEGAQKQTGTIRKLYAKKEKLSYDDIERLFAIASFSNEFVVDRLKDDLDKL